MSLSLLLALLGVLLAVASADNVPVTCGSSIKLMHVNTKGRLHSHQVAYSRGSQQQSVTNYPEGDDGNSIWIVLGPQDDPCVPGAPVRKGAKLRLLHSSTRKWLHSHLFQSPLSNNQEVSAFGSDTQTDGGDNWTIEWDTKGKLWRQNTKVRFKHVDTGLYLYSHDVRYGQPISGQAEVCAVSQRNKNTEWQAAEGVYYPMTKEGSEDEKDEL